MVPTSMANSMMMKRSTCTNHLDMKDRGSTWSSDFTNRFTDSNKQGENGMKPSAVHLLTWDSVLALQTQECSWRNPPVTPSSLLSMSMIVSSPAVPLILSPSTNPNSMPAIPLQIWDQSIGSYASRSAAILLPAPSPLPRLP